MLVYKTPTGKETTIDVRPYEIKDGKCLIGLHVTDTLLAVPIENRRYINGVIDAYELRGFLNTVIMKLEEEHDLPSTVNVDVEELIEANRILESQAKNLSILMGEHHKELIELKAKYNELLNG